MILFDLLGANMRRRWSWLLLSFLIVAGVAVLWVCWPRWQLSAARAAIAAERTDDAERRLERVLAWQPHNAEALELMAQLAEARGDLERAVEWLGRVPAESPREATVRLRQGVLLLTLNRGTEAEQALRRALERNGTLAEAKWQLARYCGLTLREEDAARLLWWMLLDSRRPTERLFALRRLIALRDGVELSEHVEFLERCAKFAPQDFDVSRALGVALTRVDRASDAVALLESCVQAELHDDRARAALAQAYLRSGRLGAAEHLLRPLPEVSGGADAATVWSIRGEIAEERGDWDDAVRAYETVLKQRPGDGQMHYRLSHTLDRLGKSEAAESHRTAAARLHEPRDALRRAMEQLDVEVQFGPSPRAPALLTEVAKLCESLDWKAEAGACYREVLTLVPSHAESRERYQRLAEFLPRRESVANARTATRRSAPLAKSSRASPTPGGSEMASEPIRFAADSAKTGIQFRYINGARGLFTLRETMGGGVAAADFDGDGRPDIFLVNSGSGRESRGQREGLSQLARNADGRSFDDVTDAAGLNAVGYFQGCAAADFDNDGFDDLYVSGYRTHRLFHNNGDGTFRDATDSLGPVASLWGTSAAFGDLNGDGDLDLYVATYVKDEPTKPSPCRDKLGALAYCQPHVFEAEPDLLFMNQGDGRFRDVSGELGIAVAGGKGLGVVIADLDDDGVPDVYVANDTTPNLLFRGTGGGRFVEEGMSRGAAMGGDGRARAGMGIACGDIANRGSLDLVVTNFFREPNSLFWNLGHGQFQDRGPQAGLAGPSYALLGFATILFDADNDGWLDLFVANGHVNRDTTGAMPYAMPPQLFANLGRGRFQDISTSAGPYFQSIYVGRGAATADFDRDGRPDIVVTHQDQPPAVLLNNSQTAGRSVVVRLIGRASNRNGIGARLRATVGEQQLMREIIGGGSYESASDTHVSIGLGTHSAADNVEVHWPSGASESIGPLAAGRWLLREGLAPVRESD